METRIDDCKSCRELSEALCRARAVISGLNGLIRDAQDKLTNYPVPDCGDDPEVVLNDLIELLDGPRQREAQRPAWEFMAKAAPCPHAEELGRLERTVKSMEESYLRGHENWGVCKWKAELARLKGVVEWVIDQLQNPANDKGWRDRMIAETRRRTGGE